MSPAACALLGLTRSTARTREDAGGRGRKDAERALAAMRSVPEGKNAAIIGRVISERPGKVTLRTAMGGAGYCRSSRGAASAHMLVRNVI